MIGGGAAGMLAAYSAAKHGHNVVLFEKNEKLGKKVYITGKGRCNLTNAADMEQFQAQVVSNPRFLYSAFSAFTNRDIIELVEKHGCPVKTERGMRVFPVSDKSSDVINALQRALKSAGVTVRLNTEVRTILTDGDLPGKRVRGVLLPNGEEYAADAVILAAGGRSYPSTGSDGSGVRLAEKAGHTGRECIPALVPLICAEPWISRLEGLSLKNVSVSVRDGKKELYSDFGEMLFTRAGVSGPIILSASSVIAERLKKKPLTLRLNLKPALTREQLDARLMRDFAAAKNRRFSHALDALFPARLAGIIVELSGIDPEKQVNAVTKEERARILELTTALTFTVVRSAGFSEAIVTQGGVKVREVDPSTMESKLVHGLFFAGEVLDVDARTGGFNLQIAWSTGYLSGSRIGS